MRSCRGFTLLELMVVVAIMAFLGLASANGYNALKRGMADRSAVDAASAFLRAAKERALVDRVPTAVFCWNRVVNDKAVGEAVAVRRAGRITSVVGDYLYDEYGDLDRAYDTSYAVSDLGTRKGFRLWRMRDDGSDPQMDYAMVADGVCANGSSGELFHLRGVSSVMPDDFDVWEKEMLYGKGADENNTIIPACAFYKLDGGTFSNWKVGTAYGLEFQRMTLPNGFIFGDSAPTDSDRIEIAATMAFGPDRSDNDTREVEITFGTSGSHKAGTARSKE